MKTSTTMLRRALLRTFTFGLLTTLLPAGARPGQAQVPPLTTTPPAAPAGASAATPRMKDGRLDTLKLGHEINVKVDNPDALLKKVNGDLEKIVLHVNGHPLTGLTPRRLSTGGNEADTLVYNLEPPANEEQRKAWHALLGRPSLFPPEPKAVSVSVGEGNVLDRRFGQLQKDVCQKDKRCYLSDRHLCGMPGLGGRNDDQGRRK